MQYRNYIPMKSEYLNNIDTMVINTKNNRFILKLFGELDHEYISIDKDKYLTISKTRIDNFEKKGQISKWQFELAQIYTPETNLDELYENEIENNDFLHQFNKKPQYKSITFIGDRNDNLTEEPYKNFVVKSIKECLNDIKKINRNNNSDETLLPIVSLCEMNNIFAIDYLKNINNKNSLDKKEKAMGYNNINDDPIIINPKLYIYEDDIIIDNITQIKISDENDFISLLNLSKKNVDYYKFNESDSISKEKSLIQILTLKLLKSKSNKCYSKLNIILYKAYKILDPENEEIFYSKGGNIIDNLLERKIPKINRINYIKKKTQNILYKLYTEDNYTFFNGVQNKGSYRLNYAIKFIKDTLTKGNNLFIIILPCENQYLLMIHDLLNNISMRKMIVENFVLNEEQEDDSINNIGEIYKFENISELNFDNKENNCEDGSFKSFSKNNSVITNVSTVLDGKGKNYFLYNSYMDNQLTEGKYRRKDINYERLRKIENKNNVINLFDILDKIDISDINIMKIIN